MIEYLKKESLHLMKTQSFDYLGLVAVDFKTGMLDSFEIHEKSHLVENCSLYFDLASITKMLTLTTTYFMTPETFTKDMLLLLEHRGGFPAWGRLPKKNWKSLLLNREIRESPTEYSDLSALRLQLEIEEYTGRTLYEICSTLWDKDVYHWNEIPPNKISPVTGMRRGKPICKTVQDDNAFFLGGKLSHSGIFATVQGLAKSLIHFNERYDFINKTTTALKRQKENNRFIYGLDTVHSKDTLAGPGCSPQTFGHLGFPGNSIWIDGSKYKGIGILSNASYPYRYHREQLNLLRRRLGEIYWQR